MFKKILQDKRGVWPDPFLAVFIVTVSIAALGFTKTAIDGTLENNAKVIACKMANNGEQYCNEKYGYTPKPEAIAKKKAGGLRQRILALQK